MGNVHSKKNKHRPSVIRTDSTPENEYSNTTATSINSILVSSSSIPVDIKKPVSEYPFPNSLNSVSSINNEDTIHSINQSSLSSENQLTTNSLYTFGKNLDIDECISRLIEVGRSGKVTKSICFKNSEIVAICRAVQEVFLCQPVSSFKNYYLHNFYIYVYIFYSILFY